MTATDILSRWDPVASLFIKAGSWLALLRIAATGTEGLARKDMASFGSGNVVRSTIKKWQAAGLITVQIEPNTNHNGNPRHTYQRTRWFITPKGLALLRLEPQTQTPKA